MVLPHPIHSRIAGLAAFAAKPYKEGELVGIFRGEITTEDVIDERGGREEYAICVSRGEEKFFVDPLAICPHQSMWAHAINEPGGVLSRCMNVSVSYDGCYKGVGFLLYDDDDDDGDDNDFVRSKLQALGDALQRNRRCDEDCYTNPHVGCDPYKQFSADRNLSQIVSIEPQGIPPLNTQGTRREMVFSMTMMATAPGEAEREVFLMNEQLVPVFQPPLYEQHARMHRTKGAGFSSFQNASFLEYYSFAPNEVVDWCIVSQFPGRHPIHLHADRMWVLATGAGGVEDCWKDQSHVEGKPTLWTDVVTTPTYSTPFEHAGGGGGGEKGGWIKMRMRISNVGVWFMHCHRDLHMNERLLVPIMIGVNSTWPVPPLDWPQGFYDDY